MSLPPLILHKAPLPRLIGDSPAQRLLKVASSADLRRELKDVKADIPGLSFPLKKGHAYLFLVSLGSGEAYSANENADYYPEHGGKVVEIPEPFDGKTTTITLGPGIAEKHKTFGKHGAVYRHHKTEPEHGVKRSGEVVWERFNSPMHRGELIVELPEKGWEKELSLYDEGIPLMWSQGNGCPFDFCSRCGFKFTPQSKSRCRHILFEKLCFDKEGRQTCIYCPDPLFYDISYVGNNPAAKIAAALLRVASSEPAPPLQEHMRLHGAPRRPYAHTLRLLKTAAAHSCAELTAPSPEADACFVEKAKSLDHERMLAALAQLKVILTPSQWARIFGTGELKGVSGFLEAIPGALACAEEAGFPEDATWCPVCDPDPSAAELLRGPAADLSRDTLKAPTGRVLVIKVSESDRALAREYLSYLVTSLSHFGRPEDIHRCATWFARSSQ